MVYKVIGLMSGSSLDGLDIAYAELHESAGKWEYKIIHAACDKYTDELMNSLKDACNLTALNYQLLHTSYGHVIGARVNDFIGKYNLHHKVHLVVSHGHTTFHLPEKQMTAQLGDGAAIAAETKLPVVTDLRATDVALGGQGAPIVPIGEKLLFSEYNYFLNLGGIANISIVNTEPAAQKEIIAFDVCPANRILNMLAAKRNKPYDEDGEMAASGNLNDVLFQQLNAAEYYKKTYPKSLANSFGTEVLYPLINSFSLSTEDLVRTYVEHIIFQIKNALVNCIIPGNNNKRLLVTGGGAHNHFLMERLKQILMPYGFTVIVPEEEVINYKEALIVALAGTLRWREEYTVLNAGTGASRNSIGGALWLGTEA